MKNKRVLRFIPLVLIFVLLLSGCAAKKAELDYTKSENWAYFGIGEE